ncbi:hypothetical protein [Holospora elegans]|uniref:hypothetical protein n=1 Tax=Holospora elegans TaxID=431043 RepID=UPI0013923710|nr:hypothetical protein [Holospora elegans]
MTILPNYPVWLCPPPWQRKSPVRPPIATTAYVNLMGGMRLTMVSLTPLKRFFDPLKDACPKAPFYLILDQRPYNTSKDTQKAAKERGH